MVLPLEMEIEEVAKVPATNLTVLGLLPVTLLDVPLQAMTSVRTIANVMKKSANFFMVSHASFLDEIHTHITITCDSSLQQTQAKRKSP